MKRLFKLIAPLLFVYAAACSGGGSGPGAVAEEFATAVSNGDGDAMLEHIAPTEREAIRPKIGLIASLAAQQTEQRGGLDSVEILSEEIDGETATVRYKVTYGNGSEEEESMDLRQVDGVWYVGMDVPTDPSAAPPAEAVPAE